MSANTSKNSNGSAELLPCPFCGSPAKFEYEHFRFFVSCHHCGFDQGERDNEKAAIDAWNRRAHTVTPIDCAAVDELVDAATYAMRTRDDSGALTDTATHNLLAALAAFRSTP